MKIDYEDDKELTGEFGTIMRAVEDGSNISSASDFSVNADIKIF